MRDRLAEMQRMLKSLGMKSEKGFDDAEKDMREAEGDLNGERGQGGEQGAPGQEGQSGKGAAVDAQGRALEALREGAQGMQKQMGQGQGRNGKGRLRARAGCARASRRATTRSAAGAKAILVGRTDR